MVITEGTRLTPENGIEGPVEETNYAHSTERIPPTANRKSHTNTSSITMQPLVYLILNIKPNHPD